MSTVEPTSTPMIRLLLVTLALLAVAALVALALGGALGRGVMAGFLLGAGLSGLGALYQEHALATRPEMAFRALGVAFLAKLAALLLGGLAFRFLEPVAAWADWRGFLIAFGATAALILPFGALDAAALAARTRRTRPARAGETGQ